MGIPFRRLKNLKRLKSKSPAQINERGFFIQLLDFRLLTSIFQLLLLLNHNSLCNRPVAAGYAQQVNTCRLIAEVEAIRVEAWSYIHSAANELAKHICDGNPAFFNSIYAYRKQAAVRVRIYRNSVIILTGV